MGSKIKTFFENKYTRKISKWLWITFLTLILLGCALHKYEINIAFFKKIITEPIFILINLFIPFILLASYKKLAKVHWIFSFSWTEKLFKIGNLTLIPLKIKYFGKAFLLLLLFNLPVLAIIEEFIFRMGTENWPEGVLRSFIFGMFHCIFGVPIGLGILLSFLGMYFTWHFFDGGIIASSLHHFSYNLMAMVTIFVVLQMKKPRIGQYLRADPDPKITCSFGKKESEGVVAKIYPKGLVLLFGPYGAYCCEIAKAKKIRYRALKKTWNKKDLKKIKEIRREVLAKEASVPKE